MKGWGAGDKMKVRQCRYMQLEFLCRIYAPVLYSTVHQEFLQLSLRLHAAMPCDVFGERLRPPCALH